jgi:hypothetical protein
MTVDDIPEVVELEAAAEWRLQQVDVNPADASSVIAARRLQALADDLRRIGDSPLRAELNGICGWLSESDNITDFTLRAQDYRSRIGIDVHPEDGEAYLRALIALARDAM